MTKKLLCSISFFLVIFSTFSYAYENNIKFGIGFPRALTLEYERYLNKIFPNLSAFVNYGYSSFTYEEKNTDLSGYGIGLRYKIPFVGKFGVGIMAINFDYSYNEQGVLFDVNGDIDGVYFEYIKEVRFGPISVGGTLGYMPNKPKLKVRKNGVVAPLQDVSVGFGSIKSLVEVRAHVGFSF
jgi:hypothetical protein